MTVASPGGHGMMWGPGVARVAADLVVHGRTDLVDVADLGLDRFDADGRSRLAADPIALPFPVSTGSKSEQVRRHQPAQRADAGPERTIDVDAQHRALAHRQVRRAAE